MRIAILVIYLSLSHRVLSQSDYFPIIEDVTEEIDFESIEALSELQLDHFMKKEYVEVVNIYEDLERHQSINYQNYQATIFSIKQLIKSTKSERQIYQERLAKLKESGYSWFGKMATDDECSRKTILYDRCTIYPLGSFDLPKSDLLRFSQYVKENLKYPEEALKNKVEGEVLVKLIINKDGSIDGLEVIEGIGYGCDEAALTAVKGAPNFNIYRPFGPVYSVTILPITFNLNTAEN
ncbi:MAG: energy transducer TonB [Cyclobacteriaceae bacterium]